MATTRQKNVCLNLSPTILDSFNFFKNAPKSWKNRAKEELLLKINKKPFKPTEEIKFGLDFEAALQSYFEGGPVEEEFKAILGSKFVTESLNLYKKAKWQRWTKRKIFVDEIEVQLIGRIDCLLPDRIIDIKTTQNFRGEIKYLSGMQHVFYCLSENCTNFEYHVYEFLGKSLANKHIIKTECCDQEALIERVALETKAFFNFLNLENVFDVYKENFSTKN